MLQLTLTAEYPLGTYAGRGQSGELEDFPSVDRLLAALLAAAGSGERAVSAKGLLMPSSEDRKLLEWFERHPPDRITLPRTLRPDPRDKVTAYRTPGTLKEKMYARPKAGVGIERVALEGPIGWSWDEFPSKYVEALTELVHDVAYVGPSDSPCVLRVCDEAPTGRTLVRQLDVNPFVKQPYVSVPVPTPGRAAAWIDAYVKRSENPKKDTLPETEEPKIDRWIEGSSLEQYVPGDVALTGQVMPWESVIVVQTQGPEFTAEETTRLAVAMHRALISVLGASGQSVDAWITGRFLPDALRPANHLAVHYIPKNDRVTFSWERTATGAFLLLIPSGMSTEARSAIDAALKRLQTVRVTRRAALQLGRIEDVMAERFWKYPDGRRRLWKTWPAAVADRAVRGDDFQSAVRTSARHVWRDLPCDVENISIVSVRRVQRDAKNYVHRMNPEALRVVYRAVLDMDEVMEPGQIVALGQSRHLGGGLLVPFDVDNEVTHEPQ